jgi:hypothetical protein
MRLFMFLCPNTRYIVQAQAEDAAPGEKPHTFFIRFRAPPADEVTLLTL